MALSAIPFTYSFHRNNNYVHNELLYRMISYLMKSGPTFHLISEAEADVSRGHGRYDEHITQHHAITQLIFLRYRRFVFRDDVEIRALSDKHFFVQAGLPDGRRTGMVRLEAAPEMLLKAFIQGFGKTLALELSGEEGIYV